MPCFGGYRSRRHIEAGKGQKERQILLRLRLCELRNGRLLSWETIKHQGGAAIVVPFRLLTAIDESS